MSRSALRFVGFDSSEALELRVEAGSKSADSVASVQIAYAGVCGTDLAMIRKEREERPRILGHEGVGRVVAGGSDGLRVGARVAFNPVSALNQNRTLGHSIDGIWCDLKAVAADELEHLVEVDLAELGPPAALVEPLATAIYSCDLASCRGPLRDAVLFGTGPIALLIAQELRAREIRRLRLDGRNVERIRWAVEAGIIAAGEALCSGSPSLMHAGGERFDAAFICLSRPASLAALPAAVRLLRPRGRLVLVGGIRDGDRSAALPGIPDLNQVRRANSCGKPWPGRFFCARGTGGPLFVTGHRGSSPDQLRRAAARLKERPEFGRLVTHVVSPEEAVRLLPAYARGSVGTLDGRHIVKLVIDFTR